MKTSHAITVLVLIVLVAATLFAQSNRVQFITVAVYDRNDVLVEFFEQSETVREFAQAQQDHENRMRALEQQLLDLQDRRADALDRNNSRTAQRLREEIDALEDEIITRREAWFAREQEFLSQLGDDEFYLRLYDVVELVAQDGGYTAVFEENASTPGLFWYSQEIDITDEVIDEMLRRF